MMNRISRLDYRRINNDQLTAFVNNLLDRTAGKPEFAFLQKEVAGLVQPLERYKACLIAAVNRGRIEIAARNAARDQLMYLLDRVVSILELNEEDTQERILEAGFNLQSRTNRRPRGGNHLSAPVVVHAMSTGRKGELQILLEHEAPRNVLNYAIEYSHDQGTSWQNGRYHSRPKFVLGELPSQKTLQFRFRALGRLSAKSPWSSPVSADVL